MTTLGKRIIATREARGISQAELARRAGISKSYMFSIENDDTRNPSFDVVMRLAWELDKNPMLWWTGPNGEQFNGAKADMITGRYMAREILEQAIDLLKDETP